MHRYTNGAGWIASGLAGVGASVGAASQFAPGLTNALLTLAAGVLTGALTRVAFDVTGTFTARIGLRPRPVTCPLGYARCPVSPAALARASSPDLSSVDRSTKPD